MAKVLQDNVHVMFLPCHCLSVIKILWYWTVRNKPFMKILFLSDNFPPESNAPARRLYEHACYWVAAGHEVTVITCAPNFPDGKVYAGYCNRLYQVQWMDGIRVVRVKTFISANEGFFLRTLDFLSFMVAGFIVGLFQSKPSVIVGTSPQFFAAVGAWAMAAVRGKPFIFEVRDIWPASIVALGAMRETVAIRLLERLELFLYQRAAAIVVVTPGLRDDIVSRGVSEAKIIVVLNGVDNQTFRPMSRDVELAAEYGLSGKFIVGYLGTIGIAHGLDSVLDAAEILNDRKDIKFLLVGGGAKRAELVEAVERRRSLNVVILPRQPAEHMPRIYALCHTVLVTLRNIPLFAGAIPSKMFEAMSAGRPVILSLPEGYATALLRECRAGLVIPPEDPDALARAVQKLCDARDLASEFGQYGRLASHRFSRERQARRLLEILEAVASGSTWNNGAGKPDAS